MAHKAPLEKEWLTTTVAACTMAGKEGERARQELAVRLWPIVLGLAVKQQRLSRFETYSIHVAEDATIHAFMKLFEHIGNLRDPERIVIWMHVTVRNYMIGVSWRHEMPLEEVDSDCIEPEFEFNDRLQLLRACMQTLSPEHRQWLYWHYWLGMLPEEIAARVHRKPNVVSAQLYRLRKILRRAIMELEEAKSEQAAA